MSNLEGVFNFKNKVAKFPGDDGWTYLPIPEKVMKSILDHGDTVIHYGLIPVEATVGSSTWKTSLMPYGDGSKFVPLNKKVIKTESIKLGEAIEMEVKLRSNWEK